MKKTLGHGFHIFKVGFFLAPTNLDNTMVVKSRK